MTNKKSVKVSFDATIGKVVDLKEEEVITKEEASILLNKFDKQDFIDTLLEEEDDSFDEEDKDDEDEEDEDEDEDEIGDVDGREGTGKSTTPENLEEQIKEAEVKEVKKQVPKPVKKEEPKVEETTEDEEDDFLDVLD